jgi:hypothetical protein
MRLTNSALGKIFAILLIVTITFPVTSVHAQVEISGHVIAELSNEPIAGASVYLENTTTGTSTAEDGTFSFRTLHEGKKTLVISFVGFHTATYSADLDNPESLQNLKIQLRPDRIELDDIVITADNSEWQSNYDAFKKEFLGTGLLASKSTIQNRWVLDFVRTSSGELYATASEPLIVENRGLGYQITVEMKEFLWKLYSDTGLMMFDLRFDELAPASQQENNEWQASRKRAYRGSLQHFLQSLYQDELSRNQFDIVQFKGNRPDKIYELKRDREIMMALIENRVSPAGYGENVKAFKINGPVDVLYGQRRFRTDDRRRGRLSPQSANGVFLVRNDGTLVNPRIIGIEGYWRSERLANKLPTRAVHDLFEE